MSPPVAFFLIRAQLIISLLLFPQPPAVTPAAGYFSVVLIFVHPALRHSGGKELF